MDPLIKSYPWNSPYAFAENDVIRSIDLEGLEKYVTMFSPMQTGSVKSAISNKDWKEVERIANYALSHGFVDKNGKSSKFMLNKLEDSGVNYLDGNSQTAFVTSYGDKPQYHFVGVNVDENFNFVSFEYLGKLDFNKINYDVWVNKFLEDPESNLEAFRDIATKHALGDNIPAPEEAVEYKWPTSFGNITWNMNRTDQASDAINFVEFIEDYKKDPEKYQKAARDFMIRFYGKEFTEKLDKSIKERNKQNTDTKDP